MEKAIPYRLSRKERIDFLTERLEDAYQQAYRETPMPWARIILATQTFLMLSAIYVYCDGII